MKEMFKKGEEVLENNKLRSL